MGDVAPSRGEATDVPRSTPKIWRYDGVGWPRSRQHIRPWIPGTVVVVAATIWGYVSIAPNGRIEASAVEAHRTDFTVFTEAGGAFFDGRDPYRVSNPRGWHYLYPPLFALGVSPLTALDTSSQVVVWYVISLVFTLVCVVEALKLWRLLTTVASPLPAWLGLCAGIATLLPFLDCLAAGQLGIAIVYALMVGFRLAMFGRSSRSEFLGGLILALPAAIKLVPALPVLFLVFQRWSAVALARRGARPVRQASAITAGVLAGAFLFLLAIPAALIGWHKNLHYLHVWYDRVVANERVGPSANFNIHSFRNQSLANACYLWDTAAKDRAARRARVAPASRRPERVVHGSVRVVIGLNLAALIAAGLALGRRRDDLGQAAAYGLACGMTLVVSPLAWGHYFMAQLPALLCMPAWLTRRGLTKLARAFAVVPAAMSWAHYVVPTIADLGLLGLVTTAWFLTATVMVLVGTVVSAPPRSETIAAGNRGRGDRAHAIPSPHRHEPSGDDSAAGFAAEARSIADVSR